MNPVQTSAYSQEDMVGRMKRLALQCHPRRPLGTTPWTMDSWHSGPLSERPEHYEICQIIEGVQTCWYAVHKDMKMKVERTLLMLELNRPSTRKTPNRTCGCSRIRSLLSHTPYIGCRG